MNVKRSALVQVLSLVAVVVAGVACGEVRGEDRDSSRPMTQGEEIAMNSGCVACHGSNGEGGVGPSWRGLYGREVKLIDGTTVIADDDYLFDSIRNPTGKQTLGYGVMPPNSLNDAEILAVVEYIKSLPK